MKTNFVLSSTTSLGPSNSPPLSSNCHLSNHSLIKENCTAVNCHAHNLTDLIEKTLMTSTIQYDLDVNLRTPCPPAPPLGH